jgi:hypothetical protein
MSSYLKSLEKMLRLLHHPAALRQVKGADILMLGPYRTRLMPSISSQLAICSRAAAHEALGLGQTNEILDFHLHFPAVIPLDSRADLAWLILHVNRLLPVGRFQLLEAGRLVLIHELNLQQDPPPALVIELTSRLLSGFFQAAPLLLAVARQELHPLQALARLRFEPKTSSLWLLKGGQKQPAASSKRRTTGNQGLASKGR